MSTAKRLKASSFLMLCFAGSTLFVTTPAKAVVNCADDIGTIGDLVTAGSCELKGVLLTYLPSTTGFKLTDFITISVTGPAPASNLNVGIMGSPTLYNNPFSGEFKYNLTAPTGKFITDYSNAISSSANGGNNTATFNLTGAAGTAMATYNPVNVAQGAAKSNGYNFITSDNFTSQVSVTQGTIQMFSQSYNFKDIPAAPGPLPLAGLGIALGYSRKLRKRIAAS
jgi:hypothetical protein